jgi:hypothetical protein
MIVGMEFVSIISAIVMRIFMALTVTELRQSALRTVIMDFAK